MPIPTLVPSKTKALLLASVPVPEAYSTPLMVYEDRFVPPLATGRRPTTPVVSGSPVTLVIVPDAGVPSAGVVSVGLVNVLLVSVCVPVSVATVEAISIVTAALPL